MGFLIAVSLLQFVAIATVNGCNPSPTTASGPYAAWAPFCSGELIFADDFNSFNTDLWQHEISMAGGNNGEFEWYVDSSNNSYTWDGKLFIKPTLTADIYGEDFLTSAHVQLNPCTNSADNGCDKWGNANQIINPIQSAKLMTNGKFQFKYGTMEVIARAPVGNWLWPAIWLLPNDWHYGGWPVSGEIDLMESRGNQNYDEGGTNIGVQQVGSTLHFGPLGQDGWSHAHYTQNNGNGYENGFHSFKFVWTETAITFFIDNQQIGSVDPGSGGFWQLGQFWGGDPWYGAGHMAPFDEEFYIILNLAVGGTNGYFPEIQGKPWQNGSPTAARDFWNGRNEWLPGWRLNEAGGWFPSLVIESVKVWAL